MPSRLAIVVRHNFRILRNSVRWLVGSREYTNFTFELTSLNREHLAWWVAEVTGCTVAEARTWMKELEDDEALRMHIRSSTLQSDRRGLADADARFGKRAGWYAIVRALKPDHVVETGTDKGLGSVVIASALIRNGSGRLTTIDVNPVSGYLISELYSVVVDRLIGDSPPLLRECKSVDLFLHDSLHTPEHELAEYLAVNESLSDSAVVLSDNAHGTDVLLRWAERTGRSFLFFAEMPANHWYPGGGIGAAWLNHR